MAISISGLVRGVLSPNFSYGVEDDRKAHVTAQGELLVANGASPYEEITRQGKAFYVNTATAEPSVIAIPTTAVTLAIYNNEPDGGLSYVIDQVGALYTVQTAVTNPHAGIIANLGQSRAAAPTDVGSTVTVKSLNGLGSIGARNTRVVVIVGGTALDAVTGVALNWFPLGASVNASVNTLPGYQQVADVNGRIIVPPGRYFAVHTLAAAVTSSAQMFIFWHERQIRNG